MPTLLLFIHLIVLIKVKFDLEHYISLYYNREGIKIAKSKLHFILFSFSFFIFLSIYFLFLKLGLEFSMMLQVTVTTVTDTSLHAHVM